MKTQRTSCPPEFQAVSKHETPLHLAINGSWTEEPRRRLASLSLLLSAGADPNAADVHGDTPLHLACKAKDLQAVARLRRAGADDAVLNSAGVSPRMLLLGATTAVTASSAEQPSKRQHQQQQQFSVVPSNAPLLPPPPVGPWNRLTAKLALSSPVWCPVWLLPTLDRVLPGSSASLE